MRFARYKSFLLILENYPTLTRKDAVTSKQSRKNFIDVKQAHAVLIVECAYRETPNQNSSPTPALVQLGCTVQSKEV